MSIAAIESAIIDKLKIDLPELEVTAYPERPSEYDFIHPAGAVLVQYDGGQISDPKAVGFNVQERDLRFSVVSLSRSLRCHNGCYDVLDRIRKSLLGLKTPGCRQIWEVSEDFVNEQDGVWTYAQIFNVHTVQAQDTPNYSQQDPSLDSLFLN
jgi:hypothetical protein